MTDAATDLSRRRAADVRALNAFGARYFESAERAVVDAATDNLYFYRTYVGPHRVTVETGDCVFFLDPERTTAHLQRGPASVDSPHIATVVRGYMPENKTSTITGRTTLPYINGCSTKQVFAPERPGDPTLQLLYMPPHSSEQAHHIHSTVRVVYVLRGRGRSVVGMDQKTVAEALYPGKVCVLEPMCPHHFETDDEALVVLPLHVFSSVGKAELSHPMFSGTHELDP